MQYVVRHKIGGGFIGSGHNNDMVIDDYGMVSIEHARAFPTHAGAKTGALVHLRNRGHNNMLFSLPKLAKEDYEIIEVVLSLGNVVGDL